MNFAEFCDVHACSLSYRSLGMHPNRKGRKL